MNKLLTALGIAMAAVLATPVQASPKSTKITGGIVVVHELRGSRFRGGVTKTAPSGPRPCKRSPQMWLQPEGRVGFINPAFRSQSSDTAGFRSASTQPTVL